MIRQIFCCMFRTGLFSALVLVVAVGYGPSPAASAPVQRPASDAPTTDRSDAARDAPSSQGSNGWIRLSPTDEVWIDTKNKRVRVGGKVCLRRGLLEMFACPKGTKEHESIVSVNAKAQTVHTALLAVGARSGKPVQYAPQYVPATGSRIKVDAVWKDERGQTIRRAAQQMILDVKTRKPMKHDWVFAGSGFWQPDASGERYYLAENGELICVSNFSSALLDLPVESPRDNAGLLFEANADNIPPLGTPVQLLLTPDIREEKPKAGEGD